MPPPPDVSALARALFESPWASAGVLAFVGAVLAWRALQSGRRGMLVVGGLAIVAALVNVLVALLVTTSGEHARRTVRQFVDAAVAGDVQGADRLLAPEVTVNFGRPENPSQDREFIDRGLDQVAVQDPVEEHRTTLLRGYSAGPDVGVVHLGCWTQTSRSMGRVPSQWVLRVERQPDGTWRIARITWVSIGGRPPTGL